MGLGCSGRHFGYPTGLPTASITDHDDRAVSYDINRSLRLRESDCLAPVMFTAAGRHMLAF